MDDILSRIGQSSEAPNKPITWRNGIELLTLAALWGGSFLFMRVAAPEFHPIPLIELRVALAATILLPFVWLQGCMPELRSCLGKVLVVGIFNAAVPFSLLAYATLHVTAGFASILNCTAPFFVALVGWFWLGHRLNRIQILGLMIGFFGVSILVWGKISFKPDGGGWAVAAAVGATFLYGIAANYTQKHLKGVSSLTITAGSFAGAALVLLPLAFWSLPSAIPSLKAWWTVGALALFCTGIAFILYFRLIAAIGTTRAILSTFLVPIFGMLWGKWALGEPISHNMLAGTAIIIAGTALTSGFAELFLSGR